MEFDMPVMDARSDFDHERGSIWKALFSFLKYFITLVVIPLGIIALINMYVGKMDLSTETQELLRSALGEVDVYIDRIVLMAIPMLIIAIPLGFYREGSYAKIPFRFAEGLWAGIMLLVVTNFGTFGMTLNDLVVSSSSFDIGINLAIAPVIYIMFGLCVVRAFLAFVEFKGAREEYLDWLVADAVRGQDDEDLSERLKSEKEEAKAEKEAEKAKRKAEKEARKQAKRDAKNNGPQEPLS